MHYINMSLSELTLVITLQNHPVLPQHREVGGVIYSSKMSTRK